MQTSATLRPPVPMFSGALLLLSLYQISGGDLAMLVTGVERFPI